MQVYLDALEGKLVLLLAKIFSIWSHIPKLCCWPIKEFAAATVSVSMAAAEIRLM